MQRFALLLALAAGVTVAFVGDAAGLLYAGGPPADAASAPYNAYSSCIRCHADFFLNSGDGGLAIDGLPATVTPGATYPLTVTLHDPGQSRWGFELTVTDAAGQPLGALSNPGPGAQLQSSGGRTFANHGSGGTRAGTHDGVPPLPSHRAASLGRR